MSDQRWSYCSPIGYCIQIVYRSLIDLLVWFSLVFFLGGILFMSDQRRSWSWCTLSDGKHTINGKYQSSTSTFLLGLGGAATIVLRIIL